MSEVETGVFDWPEERYRAFPAANNSTLTYFKRSPAHAKFFMENPPEPTPAMLLGRLTHLGILEPERFEKQCVRAPECDRRTKEGKQIWADFLAENEGREAVKAEDYERIMAMAEAVSRHPMASQLLCDGRAEQSLVWVDEEFGEVCKGRCDWLRDDGVNIDLKTTRSAGYDDFQRAIEHFDYHRQGAFYTDAIRQIFKKHGGNFHVIIAVESERPHGVAVYVLDDDCLQVGRDQYRHLLQQYQQCRQSGVYPMYPEFIQGIGLRWS